MHLSPYFVWLYSKDFITGPAFWTRSYHISFGMPPSSSGKLSVLRAACHYSFIMVNIAWASYQIRKIAGCACAGNAGNVSPRRRLQRKTLVSDPVMHHGTCVTHVPWCMSGSLTSCGGETFPAFPAHAHPQFYVSGKRPIENHERIVILFTLRQLNEWFSQWRLMCMYGQCQSDRKEYGKFNIFCGVQIPDCIQLQ